MKIELSDTAQVLSLPTCKAHGSPGIVAVRMNGSSGTTVELRMEAEQARGMASALLEAADHAETIEDSCKDGVH